MYANSDLLLMRAAWRLCLKVDLPIINCPILSYGMSANYLWQLNFDMDLFILQKTHVMKIRFQGPWMLLAGESKLHYSQREQMADQEIDDL